MTTTNTTKHIDAKALKAKINTFKLLALLGIKIHYRKILCLAHDDHTPSMHVYTDGCKCFSCKQYMDPISITMTVKGLKFTEACQWLKDNISKIERTDNDPAPRTYSATNAGTAANEPFTPISTEYLTELLPFHPLTPEARHFLFEERMLSPQVIEQCGIKALPPLPEPSADDICLKPKYFNWAPNGKTGHADPNSLLIPYYDAAGKLIFIQSRYLGKRVKGTDDHIPRFKFPKGCGNPPLYGRQNLGALMPGAEISLHEGISDTWTAMTLGFHAVAIPSSTLVNSKAIAILKPFTIHMWPDNDEPGIELYNDLRDKGLNIRHHLIPTAFNDFSEYYVHLRRNRRLSVEEARNVLCAL